MPTPIPRISCIRHNRIRGGEVRRSGIIPTCVVEQQSEVIIIRPLPGVSVISRGSANRIPHLAKGGVVCAGVGVSILLQDHRTGLQVVGEDPVEFVRGGADHAIRGFGVNAHREAPRRAGVVFGFSGHCINRFTTMPLTLIFRGTFNTIN